MKRILAFLLALVLMVGYLPTGATHAHATEAEEPAVEENTLPVEEEPVVEENTKPTMEETTPEETTEVTDPIGKKTEPVQPQITEPLQGEPIATGGEYFGGVRAEMIDGSFAVNYDTTIVLGPRYVYGHRDFIWPVPSAYNIQSCFYDNRGNRKALHRAIDIAAPEGTKIIASFSGEVVAVYDIGTHYHDDSYGNYVVIKHNYTDRNGNTVVLFSKYNHMLRTSVVKGQRVSAGDKIGEVGNTGSSQGNHLDFQIFYTSWSNVAQYSIDPYSNDLMENPIYLSASSVYDSWPCGMLYFNAIKEQYATPLTTKYTVTYHPNGGTCSTPSTTVQRGKTISSLPTASMTGMSFVGWYTQPYGGTKVTTSTVINSNMTVYAHYTYEYGSKVKLEFDPNGGTLPGLISSKQIDGVNIVRPIGGLVVYNQSGMTVDTGIYSVEVAVDAGGKVIARRDLYDTTPLVVPEGGFVLSGHVHDENGAVVGGCHFVWGILGLTDPYVAINYETGTATFFSSCAGYLVATKMGQEWTTYGALPVPERSGYVFDGWTANGYPVSYYSSFAGYNLVASWTEEGSVRPAEQMTYNGHLYERYDSIVSWTKAKALCEAKGGHLVTITNSAEQSAVAAFAAKGKRGTYKIGATDADKEGTWRWVTGETFLYDNWDQQGPEPSNGSGENYASIIAVEFAPNKQAGEWIDITNADYARSFDFYDLSNTGFICEYDYIPTCDHSYSSKVTTAATCTAKGIKTYTCTKCGDSYTEEIAAKGHTEVKVTGKAATCNATGLTDGKKCSVCGTVTVAQTTIKALGHTGGTATCKNMATCTRCGVAYGNLNASNHVGGTEIKNAKTATCTTTGYTGDTYCKGCGAKTKTGTTIKAKGHTEVTVAGKAATCTANGLTDGKKCSVCGTVTVDQTTIKAKGHTEVTVTGKAATCTANGLTDGKKCSVCGTVTVAQTTIKALGHTGGTATCKNMATCTRCGVAYGNLNASNHVGGTEIKNAKTATCTTTGYTGDTYCKGCGAKTKTGTTIKAKGHTEVTVAGKAATCTANGLTDGKKCSVCGTVTVAQTVINAKGHTGGTATCKDKAICTRCNTAYGELNKSNHTGGTEVKNAKDATCTEAGYTGDTHCKGCDVKLNSGETIPAKSHNHVAMVTEPTCIEQGYTTHTCACGDSYVDSYVDALGHNYESVVVEPTYTQPGYTQLTCSRCGDTYRDEENDALGLPTPEINNENDPETGDPIIFWEANPEADSYEIFRSTSSKSGYSSIAITSEDVFQDDTATSGKTYYYKVKAICDADATLNSAQSTYKSAKSLYPQPVAEVTNNSSGYPVVKWKKISGAKKYDVYYATEADGAYKKLTSTSSTSYAHSKASSGNAYYYQVRAYGSSPSYAGAFSEIVYGVKKLSKPSITITVNNDAGTAKITWNKITGATGYELQCSINGGAFITIANHTGTSFTHEGLTVGNSYIYRLSALCGNADASSNYSEEKTAAIKCGKPVLTASNDAAGKPALRWNAVEGAVTYEIQYATSSKGKFKQLAVIDDTTYIHEDAVGGKTYYYKVRALDANGNPGDLCSYKSVVCDCDVPVITEVTTSSSGYPMIKWSKVEGAKKYEVYYSTAGSTYKKLTTTSSTSYTYSSAKMDTEYYFKVRAYGSSTSSTGNFSETVLALRKLAQPTISLSSSQSGRKITVKWKKISGATGYELQCSVNGGEFTTIATGTNLSFVHEDLAPGNKYTYRARAMGSDERTHSDYCAEKSSSIKVGKPTLTIALAESGKPMLAWETVEGAVSYQVYYATSKSGKYKVVETTDQLTYIYEAAKAGKTCYFKVKAVDINGTTGDFSSVKSIKSK